jgi:hypothetical protein
MSQCCCPGLADPELSTPTHQSICPHDRSQGKPLKLLTLKSLLRGAALEQLDPQSTYKFCPSAECPVVYF